MLPTEYRIPAYYSAIISLSLGLFVVFQTITSNHSPDFMYTEKCILCTVSSFFNLFVLYYHFTNPPHPKFLMLTKRRVAIYTHIISGVTEFVTCWLAFFTGNPYIGMLAACASIFGHVPTSYYQTSIVFGAKALMVAGYLFAISLHLFSALHLFFEPTSTYWLLNMFLIHNVYVWCRVLIFFFGFLGLFKETTYTNAILVSGLILFPAVLGVSANLFFLGYVATSILLYLAIVQPNEIDRKLFVNERTRELLVNQSKYSYWVKEKSRATNANTGLTEKEKAKLVFDSLDSDHNGYLDGEEINRLLEEWDVARDYIDRMTRLSEKDNKTITFDIFYKHIWSLGKTYKIRVQNSQLTEAQSKARFVFECIDDDSNGYIDQIELQKLLIQWGLPADEIDAYLANDDDKQYSFDEFYQNLKPVWNFAYDNLSVHTDVEVNPHQKVE